ncbi:hypothetical protein DPMN_157932 [Dreissena polymorpha]|uniref:Uncharacterized protein n=1 Tax=Dreissena polymorpha TaxID=45954 RepID=A0A9D4ELH2_DREPO|nr:hypothetical protein DPMN_157932 [Dreissena polymorpha]
MSPPQSTVNLPDNPISKLEQAMIASKCGMVHLYKCDSKDENGVPLYVGEYMLGMSAFQFSLNLFISPLPV